MALARWRKRGTDVLFANRWWEYRRDDVELPDGTPWEYNYVHTPGSVMVIPRRDDGRFLLVRQYRYLNDAESIEFPAGGVRPGDAPAVAAQRELAEETGYRASTLRGIGRFNPFNGVTDEYCEVFLATGLTAVVARPDRTEEFEAVTLDAAGIDAHVRSGEIWDGMTLASWALYSRAQP